MKRDVYIMPNKFDKKIFSYGIREQETGKATRQIQGIAEPLVGRQGSALAERERCVVGAGRL